MKQVRIGIHLHTEPQRLLATIASLQAHTDRDYDLLLLPDGPDSPMQAALARLSGLRQSSTPEPRGAPACFNRLAASGVADVLVFLEAGALVGPGWLEHLLAALAADPRNGLAGPSTNLAWNEQCVYPRGRGTLAEAARTAQEAAQHFDGQIRSLEPLYSLADFCYAVRREVIEAVGGADETYGLGACWEMDYNIRAARAGWRGVWACAAYVWRAPFTVRRRLEEAQRFEASKRLYQNKFCGARRRGEKTDYRAHCRGDECPNFAPPALIELRHPLPIVTPPTPPPLSVAAEIAAPSVTAAPEITTPLPGAVATASAPLVSCIMPTCDRRSFVPQAIRRFLRQDYPNLELIIVDDGADSVADCVPADERIRYFRLDRKQTVGAKRNFACDAARGEFIVHWDDDDWYPERRVRTQINALAERGAEVCGSSQVYYYDPLAERAWEYRYAGASAPWVAGNTLAYRRRFWAGHRFPDLQVGEDSRFVWSSARGGVYDLAEAGLCVATVHARNVSRKDTNSSFWHPHASEHIKSLLGDDRYFLRTAQASPPPAAWPLVSCIMPTWNRRHFVPLAVQSFLRQDYPHRELIIVDDGDEPVGDLIDGLAEVRYLRLERRASIGAKRNLACQQAQGELIAHWDDDDWYSTDRLRYQALPILAGQADLTGLENAFVLQLPAGECWTTRRELHRRMFIGDVHGGTLVYRKELLARGLRYPEINVAEDAWLLQRALKEGRRLQRLANPGVFVYVRHGRNAWQFTPGSFLNPAGWERIPFPPFIPAGVLAFYNQVETQNFASLSGGTTIR